MNLNSINIITLISLPLFAAGIFLIFANIFHLPKIKTSLNIIKQSHRITANRKSGAADTLITNLSVFLAQFIKINDSLRDTVAASLKNAGYTSVLTPELFLAKCAVTAFSRLMLFPLAVIFPAFWVLIISLVLITFLDEYNKPTKKHKKLREEIELEMSLFALFVCRKIEFTGDVLSILDDYRQYAGTALRYELEITCADMKGGNYVLALNRFENRISSPLLSDVIRGLQSVIRGEDTAIYWQMQATSFAERGRNMLIAKAKKIPAKISALSAAMLACLVGTYFVVLIYQIVNEMSVFM